MYKNILQRIPIKILSNELSIINRPSINIRSISSSPSYFKKRKSTEERAVENRGGRVIRYSPKGGSRVVDIWKNMTVKEIAQVTDKDTDQILEALEFADKTSDITYRKSSVIYNIQTIRDVVKICGFRSKIIASPNQEEEIEENKDVVPQPPPSPESLVPRPPVVCVMGHVDHGKTTLLDALRNTAVVDQEFGGITQHIGAFEVSLASGDRVTFLDTPGHAAFSAMRSRGAFATDIVVLVVAADDGVMEQTVESIRMAREAGVPILVAVNKMDKPGAKIDAALRTLAQHGVVCEDMGGDVQAIPISALKRWNLDQLIEALNVQAQLMELKGDPKGLVEGVVVESSVDPRTGKQATVLVQRGTLKKGTVLVAGLGWAKVRTLCSAEGALMSEAPPSSAVSVLGWREMPSAGDTVAEVDSEKRASEVLRWRLQQQMKEKQQSDAEAIQIKENEHNANYKAVLAKKRAIGRMRMKQKGPREKMFVEDTHPTLSVLVKGDVDGSVEAILDILETYSEHDRVKLDLIHFGVGQVTPNDLEIAEAFKAVIYAFNVECPPQVAVDAKTQNITIKRHNVIYKLVDDIKEEINLRIPKRQDEEYIGEANVLQQFLVTEGKRKVPVAGSRCVKGTLLSNALYRVVRGQDVVFEGKLSSMKHLKEEVKSIKRDQECGLMLNDPTFQVMPGDTIVCYKLVDVSDKTQWDPGF